MRVATGATRSNWPGALDSSQKRSFRRDLSSGRCLYWLARREKGGGGEGGTRVYAVWSCDLLRQERNGQTTV